jgi:acyl-CoA thioesterase I
MKTRGNILVKQKTKKSLLMVAVTLIVLICSAGFLAISMVSSTSRYDKEVKGKEIKVALVGDSITYGYGYPAILQILLGTGYHVGNFGYSRRTAMSISDYPYVNEKTYQDSLNYSPDIVVIMFGTNDSKVQNWISKEEFKEQYRNLLMSYIDLKSQPVVYIGTPATPYYINGKSAGPMEFNVQKDKVDEIVEACKELAEELGLNIIDINEVTKNHSEWFQSDGIHPNTDGAKAIANAVYTAITE